MVEVLNRTGVEVACLGVSVPFLCYMTESRLNNFIFARTMNWISGWRISRK